MASWTVLLREHHEGFVPWDVYEHNQEILRRNAHGNAAGRPKSGRGGRALLSGLLRCRRCGRMLGVMYSGSGRNPRCACQIGNTMHGLPRCISFGASRPDDVIGGEILRVVEPLAVEAAMSAVELAERQASERARALALELQQAEYEVQLARRRYESVDPDNRLVASDLEARWNSALARLRETEARIQERHGAPKIDVDRDAMIRLSVDLKAIWDAPSTNADVKQHLVRALIEEIVVDVDNAAREIVLVIHWRGGRHSELRAKKPESGEHRKRAPEAAAAMIREMAGTWSDEHIAATLNRMKLKTGQGNSWTSTRVESFRMKANVPAYAPALGDGRWVTMRDAAAALDVGHHVIRRLIKTKLLPAKQVMPDAPWQILVEDLQRPAVKEAVRASRNHPCRGRRDDRTLGIPGT